MKTEVLLFYKYARVENPQDLLASQRALCERLGLKGRILIAEEGINGTLEGTPEACAEYRRELESDSRFAGIHWKRSEGHGKTFPKLVVKVRKDIVANSIAGWEVNPLKETGKRLSPEELKRWYESGEEFEIVDMRNNYEHASGHFEGSKLAPIRNFRDLPAALPSLAPLQKKRVLTVCTGGVRCEKASALLIKNGFEDVWQLDGGIVSYMEKYPNQDFKGKLYVFDNRLTVGFETDAPAHEVIGRCKTCAVATDRYINCKNPDCHLHYISCEECQLKNPFCSEDCLKKLP